MRPSWGADVEARAIGRCSSTRAHWALSFATQLDVPPPLDRQCSDPSDGVFRGSTQASVPGATQTALTTAAAQESPSARHRTPGALVLVANPGSAGANRDQLDAALDAARSGGFPALLLQAQEGAELPTLAARGARLAAREQGSVIAVGGDGTINAVAAAAIEAGPGGLPLGLASSEYEGTPPIR